MISLGKVRGKKWRRVFEGDSNQTWAVLHLPITFFSRAPRRTRWDGLSRSIQILSGKLSRLFVNAHIWLLIRLNISALPNFKLKTILWPLRPLKMPHSFTRKVVEALFIYLKIYFGKHASSRFPPLHVSESVGVGFTLVQGIHPSIPHPFIHLYLSCLSSQQSSCTEQHCHSLSCMSELRYFMFPSAPCRSLLL